MNNDLEIDVPSKVFREMKAAAQQVRVLVHDENSGEVLWFSPYRTPEKSVTRSAARVPTERWPKPTWQGKEYF